MFEIQTERVMRPREKIFFFLLVLITIVSIVNYGVWWFSPDHLPSNWDEPLLNLAYFAILSWVVWRGLISHLFLWWVVWNMKRPVHVPPELGLRVAMITCFVSSKEPLDMLERTLAAMKAVKYPHHTWVLDEGDDPKVKALCGRLGVFHFSRNGNPKYNQPKGGFKAKTKAGNHNAWYDNYGRAYDFVAQMDVDFVPYPNYLERTLGYFYDPTVAFVGSPQIYGNQKESWIARGAAEQSFGFYGPMQQGLFGLGVQLLIGANHVIRTSALRDVGGYAGHIVEDHLTGMRLYSENWRSVYVPEVLCVGEGPATWEKYLGQQLRWAWGTIDILFFHTPRLLLKLNLVQKVCYLYLQQFYFFGAAQLLGALLALFYLLFGWQAAQMDFVEWFTYSTPPFLFTVAMYYWIQRYYIKPKEERGAHLRGALLMIGAWPVFALAFLGVLIRRKISYLVTPKGISTKTSGAPKEFMAHQTLLVLLIASLSVAVVMGRDLGNTLAAWAAFTAAEMLGVIMTSLPPLSFQLVWRSARMTLAYSGVAAVMLVVFAVNPMRLLGETIQVQAYQKSTPVPVEVAEEVPNVVLAVPLPVPSPTASQLMPAELPRPTLIPSPTVAIPKVVTAKFLSPGFKGVAIGAWDPDNQFGELPKIRSIYTDWDMSHWVDVQKELDIALRNDQVIMITWEPRYWRKDARVSVTPSAIIAGRYDGYIDEWATRLGKYKQPIIVRFAQEAELIGLHPWATAPEEFIKLWRHVIPRVKAKAPNVLTLWSPAGHREASQYYPGADSVDFVGATLLTARVWDETWMGRGQYRQFTELMAGTKSLEQFGKPMIMPEVAVTIGDESKENQWIKTMLVSVKNYPMVIGLVYFNAKHPDTDYNIDWHLSRQNLKDFKSLIMADAYFEVNNEVNKN